MEQKTLCKEGIVQKIKDDYVDVLITVSSACSACHAKSFCIPSEKRDVVLPTKNREKAVFSEGEKVSVEMEQKLGGKALRIGYFYPFVILMILLIGIYKLTDKEVLAAFLAFVGVALYYFFLYLSNRKKKMERQFQFYVKKLDASQFLE